MITRKIGKLLRGKATPLQLMLACILGSMIGFMPGFVQAPGVLIVLVLLLTVLNANLFLATIVGLLAKAVALLVLSLTYLVGRLLLDGPTSGLFASLINAPVTALFGFEYYATTGGLVMGLLFGILTGVIAVRGITAFRRKMASLEHESERYQKWAGKGWVKFLTFIFIGGGKGKKRSYEDLITRRVGNPIRPLGAIAAVLVVAFLFLTYQLFSEPILAAALQAGLERANGATVDMRDASVDLKGGKVEISGLAMADPNNLSTDLLRAERVVADISARDLLRKRLALDHVVLNDASTGETRRIPGRIVGKPPRPTPTDPDITEPDQKTIEDYLKQAEQWKERLAQIREWIERISGPEDADAPPEQRKETLQERLERLIREQGYAWARASHLIDGAPTFIVYTLDAEKVRSTQLEDATIDIHGENLSTHPYLAERPPRIVITSSNDRLDVDLALNHVVDPAATSTLRFALRGLSVDRIAQELTFAGDPQMQGGTIDLSADGTYGGERSGWVNLPLIARLRNTALSIAGSDPRPIDQLDVPIGIRGPIDNPRITLDNDQLANALIQAGQAELANRLEDKAGEQLDRVRDRIDEQLGDKAPDIGEAIKDGLGGLLGGSKKPKEDEEPSEP